MAARQSSLVMSTPTPSTTHEYKLNNFTTKIIAYRGCLGLGFYHTSDDTLCIEYKIAVPITIWFCTIDIASGLGKYIDFLVRVDHQQGVGIVVANTRCNSAVNVLHIDQ